MALQASANQLTPATWNKHRRAKGIWGREQVDNSRRSSTLDLFHFGDFPTDCGRTSNINTPNLPGTVMIWPKYDVFDSLLWTQVDLSSILSKLTPNFGLWSLESLEWSVDQPNKLLLFSSSSSSTGCDVTACIGDRLVGCLLFTMFDDKIRRFSSLY